MNAHTFLKDVYLRTAFKTFDKDDSGKRGGGNRLQGRRNMKTYFKEVETGT